MNPATAQAMVTCETVLELFSPDWIERLRSVCQKSLPPDVAETKLMERVQRFAGYLSSTNLSAFNAKQRDGILDLVMSCERLF